MLQAEMKGKMPEVEGMEDVLTSNVFGLLSYIQQPSVLLGIMEQAKTVTGKRLTECIGIDLNGYNITFRFWEQVEGFGEPDLIIQFSKAGKPDLLLCVEVKYYSPKSGEGDNDQLRRYFEGLSELASLSASTFIGIIYLTKHPSSQELNDSLSLIKAKGVIGAEEKLFQLRWNNIATVLTNIDSVFSKSERMIIEDLHRYLKFKNLIGFSKFSFSSTEFSLAPETFYGFNRFFGFSFLNEGFDFNIQEYSYEK